MWSSLLDTIIGLQIIVLFLYVRVRNYIDSVWQDYGLEEEPARLTGAEKDALTKRYIEEGVFNEVKFSKNFNFTAIYFQVMTPVEIRAYQTSFPLYFAVNKMRYVPRAYREGNIPYEGVKNHIPLERMKDPETGDFYPLADIKVKKSDTLVQFLKPLLVE